MTKTKRNRRGSLDRDTIVAAAVDLADRNGVEKLTMRALADELGYKVMALYNHVGKKDELLGLMVDQVAAGINGHGVEAQDPMQVVREIAVAARMVLAKHPWSAELWTRYFPGPARTQMMEDLLAAFAATDLSPEIAHYGFHAVINHVVGYTLQDIGMSAGIAAHDLDDPTQIAHEFIASLDPRRFSQTIEHVQQHLRGESGSSFEFVLDLILDGLVAVDSSG